MKAKTGAFATTTKIDKFLGKLRKKERRHKLLIS